MPFTIHASTNPDTSGRGTCFTVSIPPPDERMMTPVSVMFDTYDVKPAVTAALHGLVRVDDVADTDEGCYLRFASPYGELSVVLPISLTTLRNSIDLLTDERAHLRAVTDEE